MGKVVRVFSPIENWFASIFLLCTPELNNDLIRRFTIPICVLYIYIYSSVFFFCSSRVNFPELRPFFFSEKETFTTSFSSRSCHREPSVLIVSVVSMTSRLFCPLPYIYVNSGTLYFNQKEKTNKKLSGSHGSLLLIS